MLRRTAFLALSSLVLSGCVTYEVVERRVYREDGSYTRTYDPYDDGRRYEERRYDRDGRVRRYEYDAPRYGGYDDDPYDRWFYGYRGYGSAWALDPYFGYSRSPVRIVYGHRGYRPTWYWSSWYSPSWSNRWIWSPSWNSGYRPWGGGYYGHGWGHGHPPSRPHVPPPPDPRPAEPRPMPKPAVRSVGPDVSLPVMTGPSIGGEAVRPMAREPRWERLDQREAMPDAMPDAMPRAKPRPVFVDTPPREEPRFEPREEPRFEPREEPRFEPREEPRFEPREEPREEPAVEDHVE